MTGQTNALLLVPMTSTNDTGSYSVVVTNIWGAVTSSPATLTINPVPGSGTVVAWGAKVDNYGQTAVPPRLSNVVGIAAGQTLTVAWKSDGTVVAWGLDSWNYHETTIPPSVSGVAAIACGYSHALALKTDGTVVAWGSNDQGEATVPAGLSGVVAIAAGAGHIVASKSDGTVVGWGSNEYGETSFASGLSGVTAIAAGALYTAALKSDGTVVAWGWNAYGQTNVPAGLSGVTAIAAGWGHAAALKGDGTVVAWGFNNNDQTNVPTGLTWVTAIAAGKDHSVAVSSIAGLPIRVLVDGVFVRNGSVVRDSQAAISLYTAFPNATIHYSTEGTDSVIGGPVPYTRTFTITNTTTIRATAVNLNDSSITESDPVTIFIRYPLTTSTSVGGTVAVSPSTSNNVVTITAIPDQGWTFLSWSGAATGTNMMTTVTADQPKALQAIFGTP